MAQAVYSAACKEYPDRRVRLCRGDEIVEECGGE